MANVRTAIDYVLRFEDPALSGVVTTDSGGRTRFGIAERFHPELTNCLFYSSMGTTAALTIAVRIYSDSYAAPLCIEDIQDQDIANKLLSLGVNCGVRTASKRLQEALEVNGDGRIGPITLDALDKANPKLVLSRLKELAVEHYEELVREDPSLAIYRNGWLARARA